LADEGPTGGQAPFSRQVIVFSLLSLVAGVLIMVYGLHRGGERGIVIALVGGAALLCLVIMVIALAISSRRK
jgi:hypothetical protein